MTHRGVSAGTGAQKSGLTPDGAFNAKRAHASAPQNPLRDPAVHRCRQPGCDAFGPFGVRTADVPGGYVWWCRAHAPADFNFKGGPSVDTPRRAAGKHGTGRDTLL